MAEGRNETEREGERQAGSIKAKGQSKGGEKGRGRKSWHRSLLLTLSFFIRATDSPSGVALLFFFSAFPDLISEEC